MNPAADSGARMRWLWIGLLFVLAAGFMERALFPPEGFALGGLDIRGLFYPWLNLLHESIRHGILPLWDPNQFAGYPFLANPQIGAFYPPTWLTIVLPTRIGISWYVVLHLWLAGVGMLLFVKRTGNGWLGAGLAAITFMLSGFMAVRVFAGHIGLIATYAWLPWLLLGTIWAAERETVWAGVIAGIPLGLAILAGHATSLVYIAVAWAGFLLVTTLEKKKLARIVLQAVLMGISGLALSSIQILPFLQAVRASMRVAAPDPGFAALFSLPPLHFVTLLVPEFFGEPIRAGYWDTPNFEEFMYYAGILPVVGATLALRRSRRIGWYYLGLVIVGLFLASGMFNPLYRSLYDPIFSWERVPARAGFLFTLGMAGLLGESIGRVEEIAVTRRFPAKIVLSAIFAGVVGAIGIGAALAIIPAEQVTEHLSQIQAGWLQASILLVIGAALLILYGWMADQRLRSALAVGLSVLVVADLWMTGNKLVRIETIAPSDLWVEANEVVAPAESRVLPWGVSIFEQNGPGELGMHSVFGYNTLEIASHQHFTAAVPDPRSAAYDVLSVGYVISGGPLDEFTKGPRHLTLVHETGSSWVYSRPHAMPLANLAYAYQVITSPEEAIARVQSNDFDPASTVILDADPGCEVGPEPGRPAKVTLRKHTPTRWVIATESTAPGILTLSETAYPGWQVAVDGERAHPLTAYTTIRGVCVVAGEHEIIWTYRPTIYLIGGAISALSLILIVVSLTAMRRQHSGYQPHIEVAAERDS
jgi:hypothetical protein